MKLDSYLDHLRQAHLTLVVLAITLLVGVNTPVNIEKAREQLHELDTATADWSYSRAWDVVDKVVVGQKAFINLSTNAPKDEDHDYEDGFETLHYQRYGGTMVATMQYNGVRYQIPVNLRLAVPAAYMPPILTAYRGRNNGGEWFGPVQFKEFWDGLMEDLLIVTAFGTPTISLTASNTMQHELIQKSLEEASRDGILIIEKARLDKTPAQLIAKTSGAPIGAKTRNRLYFLHADVDLPITVQQSEPPTLICALFPEFVKLGCTPFDQIFPELAVFAKEYPAEVNVKGAEKLLSLEESRTPEAISVIGISVPRNLAVATGLLLLFGILLYLAAISHSISTLVYRHKESAVSPEAPWLGIFSGWLASLLFVLASMALPVGAGFRLASAAWDTAFRWQGVAGDVLVFLSSLLFLFYNYRLRRALHDLN